VAVKAVSVIVCSYNSADTLEAALDSAINQRLPPEDYEVLLVDDGSTDETPDMAKSYQSRYDHFGFVRIPVNQGLPAACNRGLEEARGRYFIRLDADDTFHRDILSCCVGPLDRDETDLVYCDRYDVNLDDGTQRLVSMRDFSLFGLIAIGTMMRTELARSVGGYRPLFWEEYDLYLSYLTLSGRSPVRVPRPLYYYSKHPSSMTGNADRVRAGWLQLIDLWGETVLRDWGWPGIDKEAW
jgi:glycosyltransferase involved in cell wall biosynthesis